MILMNVFLWWSAVFKEMLHTVTVQLTVGTESYIQTAQTTVQSIFVSNFASVPL